MKKYKETEKKFSLKDMLFNQEKVRKIALEIKGVHESFDAVGFETAVLKKFPELELMERVRHVTDTLRVFLPESYKEAVAILVDALPPEADPTLSDNDFGDFIYSPYSYFVATYGCTEKNLYVSLYALKAMTKRFSVEGPIRDFLNSFPKETLAEVEKWSKDSHYHVRRLASEGTRPFLPWAKKIAVKPAEVTHILSELFTDKTRFVTRSVANHMNDVSKIDPKFTIKLLKQWQKSGKQDEKEMDFIVRHSLRTLVKEGNPEALKLLGYADSAIKVQKFKLAKKEVVVGLALEFSFDIVSTASKSQDLMVDYVIHFRKANGSLAPKTFKISKKQLAAGETIAIDKSHTLKPMSTRTLYPGKHTVTLQINGTAMGTKEFTLV